MDSRINLSAVVATALLLAAYANNAAATEPAAEPPAFSSGDAGGEARVAGMLRDMGAVHLIQQREPVGIGAAGGMVE
jgi:hypothetical protein